MATFDTVINQRAALKELYDNPTEYMQDLVYKENPFLALVPKDENSMGGKYLPVPVESGNPMGRSHSFATAQSNQTETKSESFFVYRVKDHQLVTIDNELLEATKHDADAFITEAKFSVDAGIRNITNNVAFELFGSGTASRGVIGTYSKVGAVVTIVLADPSSITSFERGMVLTAATSDGGAPSTDFITITNIARISGTIVGNASTGGGALSAAWAIASFLAVQGDVPASGVTSIADALGLAGLSAWLPKSSPSLTDNFWGVNRSADETRLAGIRYDGSALPIEEALTNALALMNREGARPDTIIMSFASYASLQNSLGAKVQYVDMHHDEVEVSFRGISFQSAYGVLNVIADRSCQGKTAYILTMDTWKLRSTNKVPHIKTYGMEGLEGLRVGNADALEVRIGYYGNLVCRAPGRNAVVSLSA